VRDNLTSNRDMNYGTEDWIVSRPDGNIIASILGTAVEQADKLIKIHLDNYVKDTLFPSMLCTSRKHCTPRRCQSLGM
jgi:hypothetical protein